MTMANGPGCDPAPGASEGFLRAVLPITGEWFWEADAAGRHTYCSPSVEAILGWRPDELTGRAAVDLVHEEDRPKARELLERCARERTGWAGLVLRWLHREGTPRWLESHAVPVLGPGGEVAGFRGADRDVTRQVRTEMALREAFALAKRAEERQRESEERFRELTEALPEGVFECDAAGRIGYVNRAACVGFRYAPGELLGAPMLDLLDPDDRERVRERLAVLAASGGVERTECRGRRKDGTAVPILLQAAAVVRDGRPDGLRGVIVDLTERKRVEAELLRAEKLESIGILAGGIAHDFNNILTGVLGNISLARLRLPPADPAAARLEEAEKASLHARELTQQLLTFAKGGAPVRRPLDLGSLLRDAATFALRGTGARLELRVAAGLPAVEADEGQLGQVVQNLVLNAAQAMPGGGTVTIAAAAADLPADGAAVPLPPGRYVRVSVSDEGTGIAPEHLPRIFDPYFTTKEGGSGLGLAVTYSVVRSHGGHVAAASAAGSGTTFTIHLPATGAAPAPPAEAPAGAARGRGRVLVMDDEALVREVAGAILEECGYEPAFAADGAAAIELWRREREAGRPFDAVIMDLTIPGGMGGIEAVAALRAIDPGVRVVVSSGYSNDPAMADPARYGFAGVVTKPYRVHDLAAAIASAVGGGAP